MGRRGEDRSFEDFPSNLGRGRRDAARCRPRPGAATGATFCHAPFCPGHADVLTRRTRSGTTQERANNTPQQATDDRPTERGRREVVSGSPGRLIAFREAHHDRLPAAASCIPPLSACLDGHAGSSFWRREDGAPEMPDRGAGTTANGRLSGGENAASAFRTHTGPVAGGLE